jgi:HEPN domain-containing protein
MPQRDDLDMAYLLLAKAREDEVLVEAVVDNTDVADSIIGFHAQQTVEKLIKAVLSSHGVTYPKTHALGYLIVSVQESGIDAPPELAEADVLSPWAVDFRYNVPVALDRAASVALLAKLRAWAQMAVEAAATSTQAPRKDNP